MTEVPSTCAGAHRHLQQMMALLPRLRGAEAGDDIIRILFDRGLTACAFARLGNDNELVTDLETMSAAASTNAPGAAGNAVEQLAEIRNLLAASLAELRGH